MPPLQRFDGARGAILAVALVFLLLLTLLGFGVMTVGREELRMAGNVQRQTLAETRAENCLKIAEADAATLVDTQLNVAGGSFSASPGHVDVAGGTAQTPVGDPAFWDDPQQTCACGDDGRYVIEYLGIQPLAATEDRYTGTPQPVHALRITARGIEGSANVTLQTIFMRNAM